jgi:very-short-patch-repair endonuclease
MFGLKFRRQVPIAGFVADFYCEELKLVVELDGSIHQDQKQAEKDELRNLHLEQTGYQVLRVPYDMVVMDIAGFRAAITSFLPSPVAPQARHPLPEGEGT